MNIRRLSKTYQVTRLHERHVHSVLALCQKNPQYYKYCPPAVSIESLLTDMSALPPSKTAKDKYYLGFWQEEKLIAVIDLILTYPNKETAWIGFFMMESDMQGRGIGSGIIEDACRYLSKKFSYIRLGYVKGNLQSEHFWLKNKFAPTGATTQTDDYEIVEMQRKLAGMV
ncbi:MAG: GNAT family N-acetyltransferase [Bacillus sp. (in: Bacteria)]|nr:GNAT family N-acetyltransferase [Bacillus sp. (in: firmicutes)]MCM1426947.1 GNAT family N-acetyltransferase [Eubacterium sp.]